MAACRGAAAAFAARARSRFGAQPWGRGLLVGTASVAAAAACLGRPVHCSDQPDRLQSWRERWNGKQLGWHLLTPHPHLQRFLADLLPASETAHATGMGPRVLLPLCGKAVDMAWLSRKGFRVVGIEGIRDAIDEFATEHGVMGHSVAIGNPPNLDPGSFRIHAVLMGAGDEEATRAEVPPPVLFVEGDFLKIGPAEAKALVPFDAAFDRGSLVAISPESRPQYVRALSELLVPRGRVLLVTVEHDAFANQNGSLGPPFEVTEADVHKLYSGEFDVRLLLREDMIDKEPAWRKRGATRFEECVYLLTKHAAPAPPSKIQ